MSPIVQKDRKGIAFSLKQIRQVIAVLCKFPEGSGTSG